MSCYGKSMIVIKGGKERRGRNDTQRSSFFLIDNSRRSAPLQFWMKQIKNESVARTTSQRLSITVCKNVTLDALHRMYTLQLESDIVLGK